MIHKQTPGKKAQVTAVLLALAAGLFPHAAQAGFEWKPPAKMSAPATESMEPVMALPVTEVDVVDFGSNAPPLPSTESLVKIDPYPVGAAPAYPIATEPLAPLAPQPAMPVPLPEAQIFASVAGFGRDMPLALVLRQIAPPRYAYSFDDGVDPGMRVSWDGGRPWNMVLKDALQPLGYDAAISGKTIRITHFPAAPAVPEQTVSAPPVPAPAMDAPMAAEPASDEAYKPAHPRRSPMAMMMKSGQTAPGEPMPLAAAPEETVAAPVPEALSATPMDPYEIQFWHAEEGESLRAVLTSWARAAGVNLYWSSGQDFSLKAAVRMHGTFQNAVEMLLTSYEAASPRPIGKLHPNLPQGPSVLIIETEGA